MSIGREENYTGAAFGHDLRGWLTFMHFQRFMVKAQISKQKANIAGKKKPLDSRIQGLCASKEL